MLNIRLYVHYGSVIAYIYCHAILLGKLVSLLPLEKKNIITLAHLHIFTHMKVMNRIYLDFERLWENILKNIILKTSNIAPKRRSKFHKKISRIHVKNQSFYSVFTTDIKMLLCWILCDTQANANDKGVPPNLNSKVREKSICLWNQIYLGYSAFF